MVNKYCSKIIEGSMLWTSVPQLWNKRVQNELVARGYTLNEDGTVSRTPVSAE